MSATTYSPTHFRVQYRPTTGSILGFRHLAEGSHVGQVLRPFGGKVPNVSGVEDGQEFFEFVEHLASVPSCGRLRG
jgi:hypothetical protein